MDASGIPEHSKTETDTQNKQEETQTLSVLIVFACSAPSKGSSRKVRLHDEFFLCNSRSIPNLRLQSGLAVFTLSLHFVSLNSVQFLRPCGFAAVLSGRGYSYRQHLCWVACGTFNPAIVWSGNAFSPKGGWPFPQRWGEKASQFEGVR